MKTYYEWFESYLEKYLSCKDQDIVTNYELKKEHTFRVKDNILEIGEVLGLDNNSLKLCEIIGLFHDVGRFKQYAEYGTFSDAITGSHGKLSIDVLVENSVLDDLTEQERNIVIKAINYHNYFSVPEDESEEIKLFSRLIRDADKLDAFYLETDTNEKRQYDLGTLSSEKEYSEEIIRDIMLSRQVDFRNIKYKFDRKLSILGLIFDLYYKESYELFQEHKYLKKIFNLLPINPEIQTVYKHCEDYIISKINFVMDSKEYSNG